MDESSSTLLREEEKAGFLIIDFVNWKKDNKRY